MDHGVDPGVRRVTLLLSRNGSLVLVPQDGADGGFTLSGLGALLVATFAGGLALNVLLVAALVSTPGPGSPAPGTARAAQAMLMLANALDCLLNVPAAATFVSSWDILVARAPSAASALCTASAATAQLTSILQTLSMLVVVLDRCLAASSPPSSSASFSLTPGGSKRLTGRWSAAATRGLLWVAPPAAAILVTAIAATGHVRIFPTRYGCGLVREGDDGGAVAVSILVLGYLAPWATMALSVSLAARRVHQQRWRRRQLELAAQQQGRPGPLSLAQGNSFSGAAGAGVGAGAGAAGLAGAGPLSFSVVDTPLGLGHLSQEEYSALTLGAILLFMYIVMLLPGIITTEVFQLVRVRPLPAHGPERLWPVVTGTYETVFTWLRQQFAIVSPGIVVVFSRDVRRRVVEMVACLCQACCCSCCCCCCVKRDNAVAQVSEAQRRYARPPSRDKGRGRGRGRDSWTSSRRRAQALLLSTKDAESPVSADTAVLFATSQGLHLRTVDPQWLGAGEDADDVSTTLGQGQQGVAVAFALSGAPPPPPPPRISSPSGVGGGGGAFGSWTDDSQPQPRYVFQFCDLAALEEPVSTAASAAPRRPGSSNAVVGIGGGGPFTRHKTIPEVDETEPSLTREELQASLGKTRSLSSSCRKNVRFASVVSEIPIPLEADDRGLGGADLVPGPGPGPLARVVEQQQELGDQASDSGNGTASSESSESPPPVVYVTARERSRARSLEMALVTGEVAMLAVPQVPSPQAPSRPRVGPSPSERFALLPPGSPKDATFTLPSPSPAATKSSRITRGKQSKSNGIGVASKRPAKANTKF